MATKTDLRTVLQEIRQHAAPVAPSSLDPALLKKSVRAIRAAYSTRKRPTWLTVNCGGPGSGRPGPCPEPDKIENRDFRKAYINLPETREEAESLAFSMRDNVIGDDENSCAVDGDCMSAAREGFFLHPDAEIWGGHYPDKENGPTFHQIVKLGDWFIDVTEDQFTGVKSQATVFNTDDLLRGKNGAEPYQYGGFRRIKATEDSWLSRRVGGRPGTVLEMENYAHTERMLAVNSSNVGWGQFSSQKSPWRVTIRRLAPYLLDLMPDLTKGQAEGIARSIQLGLRSDAKDQDVAEMIAEYGIEPERAILIARTEMARARADTKLGRLKPNERVVYVLADGACPKCVKVKRKLKERRLTAKQAEGIVPVHPNCILPGNEVECPDLVAATKSFYRGPAVKVTLLGGRVLTVTENHPILTPTGFLAAKHLRKGDQVIYAANSKRITESINPDYHTSPSYIEKVFESLRMTGGVFSSRVPTAPEDFHGDARFFDGEIEVVYSNRLLGSYKESFFAKRVNNELFGGVDPTGFLDSESALCEVCHRAFAPANGVMGGASEGLTAFGSESSHSDLTGGRHISDSYPHLQQPGLQSSPRHTQGSRYFVQRFAPFISPTGVVEVENFGYQGHVYDLQADVFELYICNGVIVKNCYCRWKVVNRKSGREIVRNDFNGFEQVRNDVLEFARTI